MSLAPLVAPQAIGEFLEMAVHCPARSSTLDQVNGREVLTAVQREVSEAG